MGLTALIIGITAALLGGAANVISNNSELDNERQDLKDQQDYLKTNYESEVKQSELTYNKNVEEANKEADANDRASTLQETYLSDTTNNELLQLGLNEKAENYAFNTKAVQNGSNTGDALSLMASSGTRSSSMAQAVDLQEATNSVQLQNEEDLQRNQDSLNLINVLNSLSQGTSRIQEARTGANDLRASWSEGGYNNLLYKENNKQRKNTYNYNKTRLQNQIDYIDDNRWLSNTTAFLTGATQGYSTWSSIGRDIEGGLTGKGGKTE